MAHEPTSSTLTPEENSTWQPQPFAARKSQHVSFGDYFMRGVFRILVGGTSGWAVGKMIDKVRGTGGNLYTNIGIIVGSSIGSYFTWQRTEKFEQEIAQLHEQFNEVPGLRRTDEEVSADNGMLKRMANYQKEKLASTHVQANSIEHNGAVARSTTEPAI